MKFSITDFFRKCNHIRRKLENFIFCAVRMAKSLSNRLGTKWFWVRMLLEKHKIWDNMLFWVRSSLTCSQAQSGDSINTYIWHEKSKQSKRNKTFINLAIYPKSDVLMWWLLLPCNFFGGAWTEILRRFKFCFRCVILHKKEVLYWGVNLTGEPWYLKAIRINRKQILNSMQ